MTQEKLNKSLELKSLIETTEDGLNKLNKIRAEYDKKRKEPQRILDDFTYFFYIGTLEGNPNNAVLNRYHGNREILDAVISILERQLTDYQKMFDEL